MSNKNVSSSSSGGIGFVGLLTIVFVALKLTGYIDWPWIWVLSPLWISAVLVALLLIIVLVVMVILAVRDKNDDSRYWD